MGGIPINLHNNQLHYDNAQKARIADALERIADALELLAEDKRMERDMINEEDKRMERDMINEEEEI